MSASKRIKIVVVLLVIAALAAFLFFGWNFMKKKYNAGVEGTTVDGVVKKTPKKPMKPTGPLMAPPPPKKN